MERDITFASRLSLEHRAALEALLFFNRRQGRVRSAIVAAIERYGAPEIVAHDGALRVRVAGLPEVQSLFAVESTAGRTRPVGFVVYVRDSFERITVLHIGIADEYTADGPFGERKLLLRLLHAVRRVARRTSGIRHVELAYTQTRLRAAVA